MQNQNEDNECKDCNEKVESFLGNAKDILSQINNEQADVQAWCLVTGKVDPSNREQTKVAAFMRGSIEGLAKELAELIETDQTTRVMLKLALSMAQIRMDEQKNMNPLEMLFGGGSLPGMGGEGEEPALSGIGSLMSRE